VTSTRGLRPVVIRLLLPAIIEFFIIGDKPIPFALSLSKGGGLRQAQPERFHVFRKDQ
jgi:hypothetical protein